MRNSLVVFVFFAGVLPSAIPSSSAQVMGRKIPCQAITSIPSTISAPGRYCLSSNFSTDALTGVEIASSDVTLDCLGFTILSTQSAIAYGIEVYPGRDNVTVQRCKLVGFKLGISAGPANGDQFVDNQIENSAYAGIRASGNGTRFVGNHIIGTRNTLMDSVGIELSASSSVALPMAGVVLLNNVVAGVSSDQNTYGIRIRAASAPRVTNNQLLDLKAAPGYSAQGISLASYGNVGTTGASLINNSIVSRGTTPVIGVATDGLQDATCIGNIAIALSDSGFSGTCQKTSNNSELP